MKYYSLFRQFILLSICAILFSFQTTAQTGCESSLPANPIKGPDSLHTDADQTFRSLTVDPSNPDIVFAGTEGNAVFKSIDGGMTWSWLRNGFRHLPQNYAETWSMAVHPADQSRVVAAMADSPGPLQGSFPSAMAGIYYSSNGGESWRQQNCGLPSAKASQVWFAEDAPHQLFCAIEGGKPSFSNPPDSFYYGGIYYADDSLNWHAANIPAGANTQQIIRVKHTGDTLLAYIMHKDNVNLSLGFMYSIDAGLNWSMMMNPLAGRPIFEFDLASDATSITALVRDSLIVYNTTNFGLTWDRSFLPVNGLVQYEKGSNQSGFIAKGPTLYKASKGFSYGDFNDTSYYKPIIQSISYVEEMAFTSNPQIIYFTTRGYCIYKSTDGGNSFVLMARLRSFMNDTATTGISGTETIADEIHFVNPVQDGLSLTIPETFGDVSIEIRDMKGMVVNEVQFKRERDRNTLFIPLPWLKAGLYSLTLRGTDKIHHSKFVKTE